MNEKLEVAMQIFLHKFKFDVEIFIKRGRNLLSHPVYYKNRHVYSY